MSLVRVSVRGQRSNKSKSRKFVKNQTARLARRRGKRTLYSENPETKARLTRAYYD
jgi:hypothetical protein